MQASQCVRACSCSWGLAEHASRRAALRGPPTAAPPPRSPPTVNGSSTVTRSGKQLGDFYRPLVPSRWPYVVRVTVPSTNTTHVFPNVMVPFSGQGVQLNVIV